MIFYLYIIGLYVFNFIIYFGMYTLMYTSHEIHLLKKDGKYLYDSYRLSAELKIIKILLDNVALFLHNTYIDSGTR